MLPTSRARGRRPFARRPRRGLSLIEILVALTLLATAMLAMARLAPEMSQLSTLSDVKQKRTFILRREADKYGAWPFDSLKSIPTSSSPVTRSWGTFRYTRSVTRVDSSTNVRKITIVITPTANPTLKDSIVLWRAELRTSLLCTTC